jgi:hypothetical protein
MALDMQTILDAIGQGAQPALIRRPFPAPAIGSPLPLPSLPGPPALPALPADPVQSQIDALRGQLAGRSGLRDRLFSGAPLPVPEGPIYGPAFGQRFLRGLVGGLNAVRRTNADQSSEKSMLNLLNLQQKKDYQGAQLDVANRRADIAQGGLDLRDRALQGLQDYRDWARQNGDSRTAGYLDNITSEIQARKAAQARGEARLGLARQREARLQQVSDAYSKLPPGLQSVARLEADRLTNQWNHGEITTDEYNQGIDGVVQEIIWQSQYAHKAMDAYAPQPGQGVDAGHSPPPTSPGKPPAPSSGKPPAPFSGKPSDNPALTPQARAFYRSQGQ